VVCNCHDVGQQQTFAFPLAFFTRKAFAHGHNHRVSDRFPSGGGKLSGKSVGFGRFDAEWRGT